jgi:hypothetical protein
MHRHDKAPRETFPSTANNVAIYFQKFENLPMYQKICALELASQTPVKAPQISAYANSLFSSYRKLVRTDFGDTVTKFSKHSQDLYYSFRYFDSIVKLINRGALTLQDLSTAFSLCKADSVRINEYLIFARQMGAVVDSNEDKPPSPRSPFEIAQVIEHVEDILEKAFATNKWTQELEVF